MMDPKYKPLIEPVPPKIEIREFQKCINSCSQETQVELDMAINFLLVYFKKARLGRGGALELLARLIQLGLIGPGPVDQEWLKKRVRVI